MVLCESFNTTNVTYPQFQAHENYVTNILPATCALISTLDFPERCDFVKRTHSCDEKLLINYVHLLFCVLNPQSLSAQYYGLALLFLISCYLFVLSSTVVDKFFCPSLKVLSKLMHLSESVAGVTLLAFGNGAPDLFVLFAGLHHEHSQIYAELLGGACFVTAIVGGCIVLINPFKLIPYAFVRDCTFYIFALLIIDYAVTTGSIITMRESIVIIILYVAYIIVVLLDQILISRQAKMYKAVSSLAINISRDMLKKMHDVYQQEGIQVLPTSSINFTPIGSDIFDNNKRLQKSMNFHFETTYNSPNADLFQQFTNSLKPFSSTSDLFNRQHPSSRFFQTILQYLKAPIVLILLIFIPIVDYEKHLNGWSKLLNCLQIILLPVLATCVLSYSFYDQFIIFFEINNVECPIICIVILITLPIAVFVFYVTRTDSQPKYHCLFAILSITGAVFSIYVTAEEIVNILRVYGILLKANPGFLAATLLAWGNSVGDLISNSTLAKQGYQKMGFAACFGGPLFNTLTGFGVTFLYKTTKLSAGEHHYHASQGSTGMTCYIFLMVILAGVLLAVMCTNFLVRRSIGVFMILLYLLFFTYITLGLFEIIHPYGTDHAADSII